ncbi:MAG TPA: tetratricopeptide repeat protein, partial [Pyrinomonadaceae bacterium]|nr:tetratricopeptide repeat protein [Pyrinomonadaceae bacterium]
WMLRGYTREAQYWYREVLNATDVADEYRWILLAGLANMSQFLGDLQGARDAYKSSLAVCKRLGDPRFIAQATRGVAGISYLLGDLEAAQSQSLDAIRISTGAGDDFGVAAASARLGDIALVQDRASDALFHGARALEIFRRLEFMPGVASKLMNLGMASIADGDATAAREYLTESLQIANEIGDYITTRLALEGIVFVLFEEGRQRDAARVSGAAFRIGDEIEHVLEPAESRMRELYLTKLKESLGARVFSQEFEYGLTLDHADVLDYVTNHVVEAPLGRVRLITARE